MNNNERTLWVMNNESLYIWWKRSRLSITKFIKENRVEIDRAINKALTKGNNK